MIVSARVLPRACNEKSQAGSAAQLKREDVPTSSLTVTGRHGAAYHLT